MGTMEDLELLKAAMAVACADGKLERSELGVIRGLAARVGVGQASFDAMLEAARHDSSMADNVFIGNRKNARLAIKLLVAEARIDGEISTEERELLVRIAFSLNIGTDEFQELYTEGIRCADTLRKSRRT